MTERKPPNLSWQSWIERQIEDARQDGAFDDLHGHGRPIDDIGVVHDELWWIKGKLRDEGIEYLPPTIAIRADRAAAIEAAMHSSTEARARIIIEEVNARIRYINSHAALGPPSTAVAIDVDEFVERWRAAHPAAHEAGPATSDAIDVGAVGDVVVVPVGWWYRVLPWRRRPRGHTHRGRRPSTDRS